MWIRRLIWLRRSFCSGRARRVPPTPPGGILRRSLLFSRIWAGLVEPKAITTLANQGNWRDQFLLGSRASTRSASASKSSAFFSKLSAWPFSARARLRSCRALRAWGSCGSLCPVMPAILSGSPVGRKQNLHKLDRSSIITGMARAAKVVSIATKQAVPAKNPAAVALGRLGGLKGGNARAASMTSERRKEIAQRAAKQRWAKAKGVVVESTADQAIDPMRADRLA
jgi:hypothetical protein